MPRITPQRELEALEDAVARHPEGASLADIVEALPGRPQRTLQARLRKLVDLGRLRREGDRKGSRYFVAQRSRPQSPAVSVPEVQVDHPRVSVPLSDIGRDVQRQVARPFSARKPVGYDRSFLETYEPNRTFYLSAAQRSHLLARGKSEMDAAPAGTYARDLLGRLLIDLSWNSSRLEGNTYSLLETQRLIELGREAEGRDAIEALMILNHKAAIEFLVENVGDIGFDPRTILNLHAILANDLLADPQACGRLRRMPVSISGSVYQPPAGPQLVEECFRAVLAKAAAIENPFEQAFFVMVQLPYLQPFDDVNKRVSRLAANIPLITHNLAPISFTEVPRDSYVMGLLGVYELRRIELLRDVFIWAYERSALTYAAQRQSLGRPDPFRLHYRQPLQTLIGEIMRARLLPEAADERIARYAAEHVASTDRERFVAMTAAELLGVRESNFARYRVRPSEYYAWRQAWDASG